MSQYPPQQPWGQPPGLPNQGDQQSQPPQPPRPQFQRPQFQRLPQSQPLPPPQSQSLPPQQSQPLPPPQWQQQPYSQPLPPPQWQQPPLPPQQQGQPSPPPKKPLGKRRIAVACAIVAVLLVSGVLGVSAFAKGGSSSSSKKTTTSTQAAQSTAAATTVPTTKPAASRPTPQSTSTAGPSVTHGTPRIGGSLSDFVGKYGQPNKYSAPPAYYRFLRAANSTTDGLIVGVDAGTNLVNNITWTNTSNSGWTVSDAQAQCMAFAPADAQLKQRVSYHDGTGYDLVYNSATLAHLFHSAEFTDVNGQPTAAGTFDVAYIYTSDRQHVADCQLLLGDQQTQR